MSKTLKEAAKDRILVLDGAMGTMIQKYGLEENDFRGYRYRNVPGMMKGNNDMLNITRPDVITDIHRKYLAAGADIISTNTFSSQRISQADYHLEDCAYDMALAGTQLARKAADEFSTPDKPRFVACSVGPTNKTCSMSPDVSNPAARDLDYATLYSAYIEQISAFEKGGADAILIETVFDTLNAKAAIDATLEVERRSGREMPIMLSITVSDLAGRTLSGQTLDAVLASVSSYPLFSIGLNCSFGADQMKPFLEELAKKAPYYISAYPNAGLPNSLGQYDQTPDTMAPLMKEFVDDGLVNIIGGCCGTTDEFIAKFVPIAENGIPRAPKPKPQTMWLSGLEMLDVTPDVKFVNVGERCNVAGSRKFLRLIKEKNYDEAVGIARKQVVDGALVIDVNMDDGLLDARSEMVNFLNIIASEPDIAKVPVMIDSSKWDVITAGLQCVQGKCIVNSISLKEGEDVFLSHARDVLRYGAAVVVMCFDEVGQATTFERRIEIAERAYRLLTEKVGMNPLDIIFDPNVLAIATGMEEHDNYAVDFIRAVEWIKTNLPGAHVSGGVSNLSFSFRGNNYIREAMHSVFLYHAIAKGMDFGIVNPATKVTYNDIPSDQLEIIEDVVLNRRKDASERIVELADQIKEQHDNLKNVNVCGNVANSASVEPEWRKGDVASRLAAALQKGVADYMEEDIDEALAVYPKAVSVIEGPLMDGMNKVGELFGCGKMFLPQVVKTARTMKKAVAILQPYIEADKKEGTTSAGKILMATVKGDVHDIGKNIVDVVMSCNNYTVIDLGVMVPAEQILRKAIEENVDMVGLSGLITPSLEEMVHVATEFERAGLKLPIMVGGATTSEMHVALKIAPVYSGIVVWVKDAAQNPMIAQRLMNPGEREAFAHELEERYAKLRKEYEEHQQRLSSLDEARKNKLNLFA